MAGMILMGFSYCGGAATESAATAAPATEWRRRQFSSFKTCTLQLCVKLHFLVFNLFRRRNKKTHTHTHIQAAAIIITREGPRASE